MDPGDGTRISIMSRHSLNDGKTPDPAITLKSYDKWQKELSPKEETLSLYLQKKITFDSFRELYVFKLFNEAATYQAVRGIITLAKKQNVTLLCIEESPKFCHRRILAEVCSRLDRELMIKIA